MCKDISQHFQCECSCELVNIMTTSYMYKNMYSALHTENCNVTFTLYGKRNMYVKACIQYLAMCY